MPVSCTRCQKIFKFQYLLVRHLNRKNPCKLVEKKKDTKKIPEPKKDTKKIPKRYQEEKKDTKKIPEEKKNNKNISLTDNNVNNKGKMEIFQKLTCEYCKLPFASKKSLYRHKNELRCRSLPLSETQLILKKRNNKKIMEIKSDPSLLSSYENNATIINNTNNININNNGTINNTLNNITNNNITNNIEVKINPIGKEDISFITKQDKLRILNRIYNSIPELVKTIHDHPENRNFYLPNTNKNIIACINSNNEIEYNDYNSVCQQILQSNVDRLDEFFNELETEINDSIRNRLEKVLDKVETGKLDKRYIKDIKLHILNSSKRNQQEIFSYIEQIEKT